MGCNVNGSLRLNISCKFSFSRASNFLVYFMSVSLSTKNPENMHNINLWSLEVVSIIWSLISIPIESSNTDFEIMTGLLFFISIN